MVTVNNGLNDGFDPFFFQFIDQAIQVGVPAQDQPVFRFRYQPGGDGPGIIVFQYPGNDLIGQGIGQPGLAAGQVKDFFFRLYGKNLAGRSPQEISEARVGRVPEDRHEGVVGEMTVYENIALDQMGDFVKNGILDRKKMLRHAEELIQAFRIKAKATDRVRTLSGGNLQKVLLARVLSRHPEVIIVPQPTRGLDIGASDYIREQLLEQRKQGAAVLLISEDLDEILALSDRIAVMYEGEIAGVLQADEANPEKLGLLMGGGSQENIPHESH